MPPLAQPYDFAIIGHQEKWEDVFSIVRQLRDSSLAPIAEEDIKDLYPFFPPRSLFDISVSSTGSSQTIRGKYIETFIPPDLLIHHPRENFGKVYQAALWAGKHRIPISTLGGFTSIVLEGDLQLLPHDQEARFTTGNTLTAALIARGVEDACRLLNRDLAQSTLLVIGATGDIGTALIHYFRNRVAALQLVARNKKKLALFSERLNGCNCSFSTNPLDFTPEADIIISVASTSDLELTRLKKGVLIADAGYPKNLNGAGFSQKDVHLFYGGMGYVKGGYCSTPDYHPIFYKFPSPKIAHGCVLEAMVLAFEKRAEPYSSGRGNITVSRMQEMLAMAEKHGIVPAPFFNESGLWPNQLFNDRCDEK
jgi:fatty aldehyde-generating acyl-ACP reductase